MNKYRKTSSIRCGVSESVELSSTLRLEMSGLEGCHLLLLNELGFSPYCANKTKYKNVLC